MGLNQAQVHWGAFPDSPIRNFSQEELKIAHESPSYAIFNAVPWQHKPANVKVMPSSSEIAQLWRWMPTQETRRGIFPCSGVAWLLSLNVWLYVALYEDPQPVNQVLETLSRLYFSPLSVPCWMEVEVRTKHCFLQEQLGHFGELSAAGNRNTCSGGERCEVL